jgi:hypothetical protein
MMVVLRTVGLAPLSPSAVAGVTPVITGVVAVYVNGFGFGSVAGTVTVNGTPRATVAWSGTQVRLSGAPPLSGNVVVLTNVYGRSSTYTV